LFLLPTVTDYGHAVYVDVTCPNNLY